MCAGRIIAPPTRKFSCFSKDCPYINKSVSIEAYIRHILNEHHFDLRDEKHPIKVLNNYLPRLE